MMPLNGGLKVPFSVEVTGLTREHLGDPVFETELRERIRWCRSEGRGAFDAEGLRANGQLVGRRFLFAEPNDALFFKLTFRTSL